MIILHRKKQSARADAIEHSLREMVLNYQLQNGSELVEKMRAKMPVLQEGKRFIYGEKQIQGYLQELKAFKQKWEKFQGDSCYLDEDGRIC